MSPSTSDKVKVNGNGSPLRLLAVVIGILVGAAALGLFPRISDFYTKQEADAAMSVQRELLHIHAVQDEKDHSRIEEQHRADISEIKADIKTILREIRRNRR
jgi:hypothetical protein